MQRLAPLLLPLVLACVPAPPDPVEPQDAALKDKGVRTGDGGADDAGGVDPGDGGPEDAGATPGDAALPDAMPASDSDGDGIPDGVDPNPGYVNPTLLSDTFEDESNGWIFSSVSMAIDSGASVLSVAEVEPYEREGWIGPRPSWGDYLVRSLIRVNAVGRSNDRDAGYVAVIARVNQVTPSRYVGCGLDLKNSRVLLAEFEGTSRTILAEAGTSAAAGTWHTVQLLADGANYSCKLDDVEVTASSGVFFSGSVGFRTFDATFDADWLEVHELQL